MTEIQLHSNYSCTYVSVPNIFIEKYMSDANGEFVKVYLYLLHCMNSRNGGISVSAIADYLNNTEKDVMRALKYWDKAGVLSLECDEENHLIGLCLNDLSDDSVSASAKTAAPSVPEEAPRPAEKAKPAITKREYTLDEVKAFSNNHEISELLCIIETFLKHPLNSTEMNSVFFWYDQLHFSSELIVYLVEYCISEKHSSFRYMETVALKWAENHITTIEEAKLYCTIRSKTYYSIMKAFGISGRNLADSEMTFVNKWTKEYGFDTELIQEACKRTISATQKPSFEYADSILTKWHNSNVHTLKDVTALDEAFSKTKRSTTGTSTSPAASKKNKFNNFNQRAYDPDALEKVLLTTSV